MKWLRSKLARWLLPRCEACGALVTRRGDYCNGGCEQNDAAGSAW